MTRLFLLAALLGAAPSLAQAQLGDPTVVDPELNELERSAPRGRDLAPPIALTIGGGAVTLGGVVALFAVGYQSFDSVEDGAPDQEPIWAGTILVGVGVPLLFAGLYWLVDQLTAGPEEEPDPLLGRDPPGLFRF